MKNESPITYQSKVMTKVKVFKKKVKLQGQWSEGQGHGIKWKVLLKGIHMWNMKALLPTNQKLWQKLVFKKTVKLQGQKSKGQGHDIKWKVLPEGIHMWKIWKPRHQPIKSYRQSNHYRAPAISKALKYLDMKQICQFLWCPLFRVHRDILWKLWL
jgi:hypothetical protein